MNILENEVVVGLLCSTISSVVAWFLAKRKYNAEIDSTEIDNMKESLEFYKNLVEDTNKKLKEHIELSAERDRKNIEEIHKLRVAVQELLKYSCVDTKCKKRKAIPEEKVGEYLD